MSDYFRGPQPPSRLSTSANPQTRNTPPEPAGATLAAETGPEVPEDTSGAEEARVRRYAKAVHASRTTAPFCDADDDESCWPVAHAVIAVADEEQAALRAENQRLLNEPSNYGDGWKLVRSLRERAETVEAEVGRLTRECLDREATETDARERLRRAEALAEEWEAVDAKNPCIPGMRTVLAAELREILAVPADTEGGDPA